MDHIAEAWQRDVDALHAAEGRVEGLTREVHAGADRASNLQGDLRRATERLETLIQRNAFLEAQVQRLRDTSLDARDSLQSIASQAELVARDEVERPTVRTDGTTTDRPAQFRPAPARAPLSAVARPVVPKHDPQDDGTDLPNETPAFIRQSSLLPGSNQWP